MVRNHALLINIQSVLLLRWMDVNTARVEPYKRQNLSSWTLHHLEGHCITWLQSTQMKTSMRHAGTDEPEQAFLLVFNSF